MDYKDLANLIFPDAKEISYYEEKYPERNLKEGAIVTRFAPSPTAVSYTHLDVYKRQRKYFIYRNKK